MARRAATVVRLAKAGEQDQPETFFELAGQPPAAPDAAVAALIGLPTAAGTPARWGSDAQGLYPLWRGGCHGLLTVIAPLPGLQS